MIVFRPRGDQPDLRSNPARPEPREQERAAESSEAKTKQGPRTQDSRLLRLVQVDSVQWRQGSPSMTSAAVGGVKSRDAQENRWETGFRGPRDSCRFLRRRRPEIHTAPVYHRGSPPHRRKCIGGST
eukprot:scaffold1307_cov200-Pinguiococcus_pyrenoidosus.AAC.151